MWSFWEKINQFLASHQLLFGVATVGSVVLLLGTLAAIPVVVVRLPADYLVYSRRRSISREKHHMSIFILLVACKNLLGILLIVLGVIMLITPGQGLLAILTGISVSNLPGKYRLERWLIIRGPIWKTVGYLRQRAGAPPMQHPRETGPEQ